jgi:hypothetical protein
LIDNDGKSDSFTFEVLECDVRNVAIPAASCRCSRAAASESLDSGSVLSVDHCDVLDKNIGHDILDASILAQGAD